MLLGTTEHTGRNTEHTEKKKAGGWFFAGASLVLNPKYALIDGVERASEEISI
jgi:hypothetical protein